MIFTVFFLYIWIKSFFVEVTVKTIPQVKNDMLISDCIFNLTIVHVHFSKISTFNSLYFLRYSQKSLYQVNVRHQCRYALKNESRRVWKYISLYFITKNTDELLLTRYGVVLRQLVVSGIHSSLKCYSLLIIYMGRPNENEIAVWLTNGLMVSLCCVYIIKNDTRGT